MLPSKKPKVFYGYWILVAAFFCLFIVSGCGFYSFSLFVGPLEADFGWDRGEIMLAFTIYMIVVGVASPFVGRLLDRYGARKVIFTGALIGGLGFALLSLTNDLWHFYAGWFVGGIGFAAMGILPTTAVVSNWFKKKRGMAIGLMSTGIGLGPFVLAPLIGSYIIPHFGWRLCYLAFAILTWVLIIPLALLVIKTKPADMGLYPDDTEASEAVVVNKASFSAAGELTLKEALATSPFWLILISVFVGQFALVGGVQSQVPYLEDIGFLTATAATALGGVGITSAVGKIAFGWLCDRIPAKYVWAIGLGLALTSIVIIMNIGSASPLLMVWLYAIAMGLAMGSWVPAMSMLASTSFGLVSYGAIFGVFSLAQQIGASTGPLMAGYMYDAMKTYHWAFIIFLALCAVGIVASLLVRRPKGTLELQMIQGDTSDV
jgi:MFS family permease